MAEKSKGLDIAALVVSILALIASVGSPFITYQWLQNDVRLEHLKGNSLRASMGGVASSADITPQGNGLENFTRSLQIKNTGVLSVHGVEVIYQDTGSDAKTVFGDVRGFANPPRKITTRLEHDSLIVSFDDPIAPDETVELTLGQTRTAHGRTEPEIPIRREMPVWIRSETSPPIPIPYPEPRKDNLHSSDLP
jgi:hypothetical protein